MCSVYRQSNIYLQKYLQIHLKDAISPNENREESLGYQERLCVFTGGISRCMLPCGKKDILSYDTDRSIKDVQKYVTFKEDISKKIQKNDYYFLLQ